MVPTGHKLVSPRSLFDAVRKRARLWRAWAAVHQNAIASKSLETRGEARQYARDIPRHLERISTQLRQNRFEFCPSKGVLIPKNNGKSRPIVIAPIESRIVQRSILDTLQDIPALRSTLCAGYNFGGVPGKDFGVPGAIVKAQSEMGARPYYIRTDVKSFFDRVNRSQAIDSVLRFTDDQKFADLFKSAVATELADAEQYGENVKLFPLHDQGVAQGSCLSPLLCNLLLSELDRCLNARGIVGIRYIDDILILGRTSKATFKAFASAKPILASMGLEFYDPRNLADQGKAEHGSVGNGLTFLGCELNGQRVRPSRENTRSLISTIRAILNNSLHQLCNPAHAIKVHASYAETIVLVNEVVRGWANTFAFCSDDRLMGSLDAEIDEVIADYTDKVWKRLSTKKPLDRRRGIGVFAIADRVQPVSAQLIKSIARKSDFSADGDRKAKAVTREYAPSAPCAR